MKKMRWNRLGGGAGRQKYDPEEEGPARGRFRHAFYRLGIVASFFVGLFGSPLLAAQKPPFSPDQATRDIVPSRISATIEFSGADLTKMLDREIPRRLATFNDRISTCARRRFFGNPIVIQCAYSGYVERRGPVSLRAEGDRITVAIPVYGAVVGQGARGLARLLSGHAEGAMTVYAVSHPQLNRDWSLALRLDEGFRWTRAPVLTVFGYRVSFARFVEPRIESILRHVGDEVAAKAGTLDLRQKAETAWKHAFEPVKIIDSPEVWLQMTPQAMTFSGIRADHDILEGSVEISGPLATSPAKEPPPQEPTPLPDVRTDVVEPGKFDVIVPITVSYQTIKEELMAAITASVPSAGAGIRDVDVYPSGGKIVVGLQLATPSSGSIPGSDGWIYLSSPLSVDDVKQTLHATDLALTSDSAIEKGVASSDKVIEAARQADISFKDAYEKAIASVDARLSRDLGEHFRSEAKLTSAALDKVLLLADGVSVNLRATGDLKIIFTP